jgi:hypothetical protein
MAVITDFPHIYGVLFKKISSHISWTNITSRSCYQHLCFLLE